MVRELFRGSLTTRQSSLVTHENFPRDMDGLERELQRFVRVGRAPWKWGALVIVTLSLIMLVVFSISQVANQKQSKSGEIVKPPGDAQHNPAGASAWNYGPPAAPETREARVVGFSYQTPPQEVDPGLRIFRREADDTWTNTYPSGHTEKGSRVRARIVLEGCNGSVIGPNDEPDFAVFIPDKGCPGMMARWRRGAGHWNVLGSMQNVR